MTEQARTNELALIDVDEVEVKISEYNGVMGEYVGTINICIGETEADITRAQALEIINYLDSILSK